MDRSTISWVGEIPDAGSLLASRRGFPGQPVATGRSQGSILSI